jgi:fructose-1,6-bisphosphatase/inositol monophosphatase family enzyme
MIWASLVFGQYQTLGEEAGVEGEPSRYRWILDPIDGTFSFSRGLALEDAERGESVVGAIHLPCFHETYVAARGLGSWCNGEPVRASTETDLRTALISAPDPLQLRCAGLGPAFHQLWDRCDRLRGYTDRRVHVQAVRGAVDAVIEPHVNVWDICATQLLVEAAGAMQLTRDSTTHGMYDCLFGSPALVERLTGILGF